jgi:cytochrome c biogenesis protein CcdA
MQETSDQDLDLSLSLAGRLNILLHALLFVLGFTVVFVIGWGGATTLLGSIFYQYKDWIARIGGVVLIVFGLATMDVIRILCFIWTPPRVVAKRAPTQARWRWGCSCCRLEPVLSHT